MPNLRSRLLAIGFGLVALGYVFSGSSVSFAQTSSGEFIRGDANQDSVVGLTDAIFVLNYLIGNPGLTCEKAADSNDDGAISIADPIYLLSYLFASTSAPPSPFPDCGLDPTSDGLACASFVGCP